MLNILNIWLTLNFSVYILFHYTIHLNRNKLSLLPVNRRVAQLIHLLGTLAAGKTRSYTCNLYLLVGLCSTVKQFIVSDWTEFHFQETFTAFVVKIFPLSEFDFHFDDISFFLRNISCCDSSRKKMHLDEVEQNCMCNTKVPGLLIGNIWISKILCSVNSAYIKMFPSGTNLTFRLRACSGMSLMSWYWTDGQQIMPFLVVLRGLGGLRLTEKFGLERTLKIIYFQPPATGRGSFQ